MENTAARVQNAVELYGDMLFRICCVMLGSAADAEDAAQENVVKYLQKAPAFADAGHEKAWLITTARNQCRDMLRRRLRHPQVELDYLPGAPADAAESGILEALMALPEKFRLVLVLHYVEEYRVEEIARIIRLTPSAVKMRLQKGRRLLAEKYRKEYL